MVGKNRAQDPKPGSHDDVILSFLGIFAVGHNKIHFTSITSSLLLANKSNDLIIVSSLPTIVILITDCCVTFLNVIYVQQDPKCNKLENDRR